MLQPRCRSLKSFVLCVSLSALTIPACGEDRVSKDGSGELLAEAVLSAPQPSLNTASWSGIVSSPQPNASAAAEPAARAVSLAEKIRSMPRNTGLLLPNPSVIALDADLAKGPPPRDYSNRMVYSLERQTALFLGAGHNMHRRNDVWEFHLASNTWQQLFPSDGGSHTILNSFTQGVIWQHKQIAANGFTPAQLNLVEATRQWWRENTRESDGRVTTKNGGPLLPFHTWDAVVFDDSVGKLLWAVGANWLPTTKALAMLRNSSVAEEEGKLLPRLSNMWSFDPSTQQYLQLRNPAGDVPDLRGMGSSMVYLPDHKKTLYYAAASNVTPGEFGMFLYDARQNSWQPLLPNNGKTIRELVTVEKVAPWSEKQMAYSPKHQSVLAVLKNQTYLYDLPANRWERLADDDRIYGHDAFSVLVYDAVAEVFVLVNPYNEVAPIARFSPETRRWKVISAAGDSFLGQTRLHGNIGYYDPTFERVVIRHGRGGFWVYRP